MPLKRAAFDTPVRLLFYVSIATLVSGLPNVIRTPARLRPPFNVIKITVARLISPLFLHLHYFLPP